MLSAVYFLLFFYIAMSFGGPIQSLYFSTDNEMNMVLETRNIDQSSSSEDEGNKDQFEYRHQNEVVSNSPNGCDITAYEEASLDEVTST